MPIDVSGRRFSSAFPDQRWYTPKPVLIDPEGATRQYDTARQMGMTAVRAGGEVISALTTIEEQEGRTQAIEVATGFDKWARDYTLEKKANLTGKNAVGLSPVAARDFSEAAKAHMDSLGSPSAKALFQPRMQSIINSHLDVLASHELSQLEKYRTDTMNSAFSGAAEDIKLSTGDPKVVREVISQYESDLSTLYEGQDVSFMKQQHRSLLEKAGREAQNKFAETRAYDIVRGKFTTFNEANQPILDYEKAKNYLVSNPDNVPEIASLTIQQREQLGNFMWSDGERSRTLTTRNQEKVEGDMFSSYLKLTTGQPMGPGEPPDFLSWYKLAEEYAAKGQIRSGILNTVISYAKSEEALNRQLAAAKEAAKRRETHEVKLEADKSKREQRAEEDRARREEDRQRTHNPLIMSNPNVLAPLKARILAAPDQGNVTEILGMVGKGIGISDAQELIGIVQGAPKKIWGSPTGSFVSKGLGVYYKNYHFDTDIFKNNKGYGEATAYFQKWLQNNPNATTEQADKEMRTFMYPYVRGKIGRWYDSMTGNPKIVEGE